MHSSFNHVFFTRSLNLIYHKHATSASGITILRFLRWCLSAQHFTAFSILKVFASGVFASQQETPCPIMMNMNVVFAPDISVHNMPWILTVAANTCGVKDATRHSGQSRQKGRIFNNPMPTICVDCALRVRTSCLDASLTTTWFQNIISVWPVTSNTIQAHSLTGMMLPCTIFVSLVGNILPIQIACKWY